MTSASVFESTECTRRRWSPRTKTIAIVPGLAALGLLLTSLVLHTPHAMAFLPHVVIASLLGVIWARARFDASYTLVAIRASREGIRLDDKLVPRERIRDAVLVPQPSGAFYVRIRVRRGLPIEVGVQDAAEGRALLRALGFDVSQTATRFVGGSLALTTRARWMLPALVGVFAFGNRLGHGFLAHSFPLLFMGIVGFVLGTLLWPSTVQVGADGVMVRWAWTKRFIPAGSIESVSEYERERGSRRSRGVAIKLRDGEVIKVPVGRRGLAEPTIAAMVERVREAVDTYRRGDVESAAAMLDRGGRDVPAWIEMLRAIGVGANATLRVAPIDPERLLRVVESPTARPSERAAAAVALGASNDEEGKARMRIAADAVVLPKLRVAIEAASQGDMAALEGALEELSTDEREAH